MVYCEPVSTHLTLSVLSVAAKHQTCNKLMGGYFLIRIIAFLTWIKFSDPETLTMQEQ